MIYYKLYIYIKKKLTFFFSTPFQEMTSKENPRNIYKKKFRQNYAQLKVRKSHKILACFVE